MHTHNLIEVRNDYNCPDRCPPPFVSARTVTGPPFDMDNSFWQTMSAMPCHISASPPPLEVTIQEDMLPKIKHSGW